MRLLDYIVSLVAVTPDPAADSIHVVSGGADKKATPSGIVAATNTVATVAGAGTTQATATVLTKRRNVVTSAPASSGVMLTLNAIGDPQFVVNRSGASVLVYPPVGGAIEAAGTNNGITLQDGTALEFFPGSSTQWWTR